MLGRSHAAMSRRHFSAKLGSRGENPVGALVAALETKRIACAALDVYDIEPLPADYPLLKAPNTVLTPHVGITTDANYAAYYRDAAENVVAWLAGAPIRVVDGKRPATGAWA